MSDDEYDDIDFDELDWDDDGNVRYRDEPTPEDVFKMVTICKTRKVRLSVELHDGDDEIVLISEAAEAVLNYMKEKSGKGADNDYINQIAPFMAQLLVSGLGRRIGIRETAFLLSNDIIKFALTEMMSMSFLMLKFMQAHGLKLRTLEEDVTDEEIEEVFNKNRANKNQAAAMGLLDLSPKDVMKFMMEEGMVSKEDLRALLHGDDDDDVQ